MDSSRVEMNRVPLAKDGQAVFPFPFASLPTRSSSSSSSGGCFRKVPVSAPAPALAPAPAPAPEGPWQRIRQPLPLSLAWPGLAWLGMACYGWPGPFGTNLNFCTTDPISALYSSGSGQQR
ncbi:hypothetical protein AXG93_3384s1300 [Marchantia polymorpha subsp. ruderalis]|uniref:Uncharacterized protein n=1 Tax=Marchantia polymorpha subsp. ruderalis TaxID=1480154 RepID=A0A176WHM8_MARPO|nr:hypothetical protein AXG93_3384s1300 [Marchantia polymorpha subsp. ruderalis]